MRLIAFKYGTIKKTISLIVLFNLFWSPTVSFSQKLSPEMLGMPREEIRFSDNQLRLFNGRGCIYVKQNSLTGMHGIQFPPIDVRQYQFRLDFRDDKNNILMQDNIPELWEDWKLKRSGYDPLGVNFRAGYPYALISQNEYWMPNSYYREGTFHKKYGKHWVSFAIETETMVSGSRDEVYLEVRLTNRSDQPLSLTLIPVQLVRFEDAFSGVDKTYRRINQYTLQNSQFRISVGSDLREHNEDGWKWLIPGKSTSVAYFAIHTQKMVKKQPDLYLPDIEQRMLEAEEISRKRLEWAAENLPLIKTENGRLDEFYKRCILTVAECKWERENFIINPFWSSGSWIYTIPWDLCFLSDMLTMISPASMQETISLSFSEENLDCTYMGWDGCAPSILYIMQPFALKMMIDSYLRQTGDVEFFNTNISGHTILYWMKAWGDILINDFTSKTSGMIDIGQDTETLIEIRTDGYDHIVPVLNGHAVAFYQWLDSWCRVFNERDSTKFGQQAIKLEKLFHEKLWNADKRWFDNVYPDGGRKPIFSVLEFDLLGLDILTGEERLGFLSHLNDNEFMGPYSIYSISRQNRVNWDRADADWGGSGTYTGTSMQLVRNLYQSGMGSMAWTILRRFTQYVDYFPYISQNYRADEPFQDESSQPMAICAGAGVEAILFGLFGLTPHIDGTLDIHPYYAHELGQASLIDYRFRGRSYGVTMDRYGFHVTRDTKSYGPYPHGKTVRFGTEGRIMTHEEMRVAVPIVETDKFVFVDTKEIILKSDTPGASIYYTLDGSHPSTQSKLYERPFSISKSCQIKAIAFYKDLIPSKISVIDIDKVDTNELETPPLMIKDFLISQSFHGYVGPEGKNNYPLEKSGIEWKKAQVDERGIVWLSQQLTPFAHCHAFALTEIISDKEIETTLLTGTNDGAFIWLNETLIYDNYRERPLYYNQYSIPIRLKHGKNTLVLMVMQAGGSWGFHINLKTKGAKLRVELPEVGGGCELLR